MNYDEFWTEFQKKSFGNTHGITLNFHTNDRRWRVDMRIEKVIFNEPATIVLWQDGTKTVVKASPDEPFDPEKGLAMAISKKALGNKGNYYNVFKKPLEEYEEKEEISSEPMKALGELVKELRGGRKK